MLSLRSTSRVAGAIVALFCFAEPDRVFSEPVPKNGIYESCTFGAEIDIDVHLTDKDGKRINAPGWPVRGSNSAVNEFCSTYQIPKQVVVVIPFIDVIDVKDVDVEHVGGAGIEFESNAKLESLLFDSAANEFVLVNIFGTLEEEVGLNQEVLIPDLYADTDGSGSLGLGDILYSVVDLNQYLISIPPIVRGGGNVSYNIVNGTTALLPGMLFSTTPFVFNAATGFEGTNFTGMAEALGSHGITSVPEPSMVVLLGFGTLGGLMLARFRR